MIPKPSTTAAPRALHILVVDDEREMCELVAEDLTRRGYRVSWYTSASEGLAALDAGDFAILLADINMEGYDGLELCQTALAKRPDLIVMVMTGFGSMEHAVRAIRAGASDFITKPISMDMLALTLERALRQLKLQEELKRMRERAGSDDLTEMVSGSPLMERVFELVSRVAASDTSVLITGESGTGKELVARALHKGSGRRGPFLAINCAAIPERLLESELFGYVRGAFTDAVTDRAGLFTEARGGTLFLDEIGELPLGMQAKILRALQERKVRPVGTSREVAFDARVITATNRDLELEISERRFREDLYYRINVVCIDVPPLRARGNDVSLLAQHFLERAARRSGTPPLRVGDALSERLSQYDWPGNVRELENCIERIVALSRYDEATLDDLPQRIRDRTAGNSEGGDTGELPSMAIIEERYLRKVLAAVGGSSAAAAKVLEMPPALLSQRLKTLGIHGQ